MLISPRMVDVPWNKVHPGIWAPWPGHVYTYNYPAQGQGAAGLGESPAPPRGLVPRAPLTWSVGRSHLPARPPKPGLCPLLCLAPGSRAGRGTGHVACAQEGERDASTSSRLRPCRQRVCVWPAGPQGLIPGEGMSPPGSQPRLCFTRVLGDHVCGRETGPRRPVST